LAAKRLSGLIGFLKQSGFPKCAAQRPGAAMSSIFTWNKKVALGDSSDIEIDEMKRQFLDRNLLIHVSILTALNRRILN
jgi:hypothetical protein